MPMTALLVFQADISGEICLILSFHLSPNKLLLLQICFTLTEKLSLEMLKIKTFKLL